MLEEFNGRITYRCVIAMRLVIEHEWHYRCAKRENSEVIIEKTCSPL